MGIWALYNPKMHIWPLIGLPDLAGDHVGQEFTSSESESEITLNLNLQPATWHQVQVQVQVPLVGAHILIVSSKPVQIERNVALVCFICAS